MARDARTTRSEQRAAQNEVSFREANERLEDKRRELEAHGQTPFFCECGDPGCTQLLRLSLEEYEHVRSHANWFLVAVGHESPNGGAAAERHDGYEIVAKEGEAGRIAEEEDPRR